jgi:hypothetical protein
MVICLFLGLGCKGSDERSVTKPGLGSDSGTGLDTGEDTAGPQNDCENLFEPDTIPAWEELGVVIRPPPLEEGLPVLLSGTPLFADIVSGEIHPAMLEFEPRFHLWSDNADKRRWAYIPECETIGSADLNDWDFPVGTRLFKEFSLDGVRIETRILERMGLAQWQWAQASYLWNEDETEATRVGPEGLENAKGTTHDIPSKTACLGCHGSAEFGGGRPSRGLGFSAVQLSHEGDGVTLSGLVAAGKLSHPPETMPTLLPDGIGPDALGYLHANCGQCHNSTADRIAQVDLDLWLDVGVTTVEESAAWRTAVGQPTSVFSDQHVFRRIVAGSPEDSALLYRMAERGNNAQMPPLGTEYPDPDGLSLIAEWIGSMP